MISVCMATYNGGKYIERQLISILRQLGPEDEIVISDDGSSDNTVQIINSLNDSRILFLAHERNLKKKNKLRSHYLVSLNFENALKNAKGDFIFLADQDDIWADDKVEIMMFYLKSNSLVMSDCKVIDEDDNIVKESFFNKLKLPRGIFLNIKKPVYHGCCMAFKKDVLIKALPFPEKLILHDTWIGILAENLDNVKFIEDKLVFYRRHSLNTSFLGRKSNNTVLFQIKYRVALFFQITERILCAKLS
ncbi:glycosyltransferase family 2 protein [Flavobacterium pectinovorum]|uniref:glycosyltransferase family 2 protein n=1 Tax=Flavobacterium pectinovorum TaxID=29533 RepID=UPI001FAC40E3|nr:glycosyltransferase family 2 protein [Flavobacterium pectinovorum]MCI9843867.1 glycosyltransferase family 2 protein [Flavobacterium pectinovorum]